MEEILKRLEALETMVAKLKPLTWIGEPVWYCSGGKDCCEYAVNRISKIEEGRIKVKCEHASEWIPYGDPKWVEDWIKEGYRQLKIQEEEYGRSRIS